MKERASSALRAPTLCHRLGGNGEERVDVRRRLRVVTEDEPTHARKGAQARHDRLCAGRAVVRIDAPCMRLVRLVHSPRTLSDSPRLLIARTR